ncbi:uncharacterized protein E0L32_005422 [Thyridium curvatum]|uniref:tRNA (uracil-O(2)-)-methyltransferase n=1 Tax=Thyridium curvatum TaxID=1093900 RepID=A0A507BC94_9PEZI|nr:uncharacterized protein E0L32_005422 [Thyridium curvatum]TPX14458.1 hypothetical protein E0L32_005422 [Thyridium curvatum]
MTLTPEAFAQDAAPLIRQTNDQSALFSPICRHGCAFDPAIFKKVMLNLIQNPNLLSNWLFRADLIAEHEGCDDEVVLEGVPESEGLRPVIPQIDGFQRGRVIVRRLIPRNAKRDRPLLQTCIFYNDTSVLADAAPQKTLVVYLPHIATVEEIPFYHPKVRGLGYLHEWNPAESKGTVSIHYRFLSDEDRIARPVKLERTALMMISVIHKHGEGKRTGYVKRVHHDQLVPQATVQDCYHDLKDRYARDLLGSWRENTDPGKHVFEDLSIAAFLIELWREMYKDQPFPGFVDIGCGNGLLTYLLNKEGYKGWGFDARARKSWDIYNDVVVDADGKKSSTLQERVLLPSIVAMPATEESDKECVDNERFQDGRFPKGTFIVSNHADELTPWTPILGAISDCPWISIPCCSHNLTGAKFRAAPPKDKSKGGSAYASLTEWVADIAADCGWVVEREMLRIPSTRNAALVGRKRTQPVESVDIDEIILKYGGTQGYFENAMKLVKTGPRSH